MTSITEIQNKFSPSRIDFESCYEWLLTTNSDTQFASFACKLKSYHKLVTKAVPRQPDHRVFDKTLDLFWTLFYNWLNCAEVTDVEKFNINMDILSHFFYTYKDDFINKKDILRQDIKNKLTKKKYGTWLAMLEMADKLSDKLNRPTEVLTFDFDSLLDRNDMFMHDFGIEAIKEYYKN